MEISKLQQIQTPRLIPQLSMWLTERMLTLFHSTTIFFLHEYNLLIKIIAERGVGGCFFFNNEAFENSESAGSKWRYTASVTRIKIDQIFLWIIIWSLIKKEFKRQGLLRALISKLHLFLERTPNWQPWINSSFCATCRYVFNHIQDVVDQNTSKRWN